MRTQFVGDPSNRIFRQRPFCQQDISDKIQRGRDKAVLNQGTITMEKQFGTIRCRSQGAQRARVSSFPRRFGNVSLAAYSFALFICEAAMNTVSLPLKRCLCLCSCYLTITKLSWA